MRWHCHECAYGLITRFSTMAKTGLLAGAPNLCAVEGLPQHLNQAEAGIHRDPARFLHP